MLVLTFTTGIVDAVGFLGLDRVFAGNMTGNVVILGMGLTGVDDLPVLGPAVAVVAFLVGAAAAGRVTRRLPNGTWSGPTITALACVAAILVAVAGVLLAAPRPSGLAVGLLVTAGLALAMGAQAATARQIAVRDITTVVVTSTLSGLAADSWFGAGRRQLWRRRAAAVVVIAAGATAGAALQDVHPGWGIGVAGVLTVAVTLGGAWRLIAIRSGLNRMQ